MLRVGIAGLKRGNCYYGAFNNYEETTVTAVCDTDEKILEEMKRSDKNIGIFTDYKKFLREPFDILVVATPAPMHADQAIMGLESGKHVLSEVPAAMDLDDCKKLAAAVRRAKTKYMLAENANYFHPLRIWRQWAEQGKLGKIFYAETEYVHDCRILMKNPDGTGTWRASLPPIYYPTHNLGPLLAIMKDRCVTVCGFHTGSRVSPEIGAISMEVGILKTEKGAVIKLLCGFSVEREPYHLSYVVYGTKGCLETHSAYKDETFEYIKGEHKEMTLHKIPFNDPSVPTEKNMGGHGTSEYHLIRDFVKSIINDTVPPIDIYKALDMTVPGICAHASAQKNGRPVNIPDFR